MSYVSINMRLPPNLFGMLFAVLDKREDNYI